jgi:hypothetical protein
MMFQGIGLFISRLYSKLFFLSLIKKIIFLFLDIFVFLFCGIYMMGYDDFYDETQGEYYSLLSMEIKFKIVWIFYNFWILLNCFLLLYLVFRMFKKLIIK